MKGWMSIPVLVLAMASAQARDTAQDEREILRAEAALCEAFESGDAAYLRGALDPRFTLVDSRGTVTNLEQNLQEVQAREPRYEKFHNHGQSIRVYGDTAIVTGVTSVKERPAAMRSRPISALPIRGCTATGTGCWRPAMRRACRRHLRIESRHSADDCCLQLVVCVRTLRAAICRCNVDFAFFGSSLV